MPANYDNIIDNLSEDPEFLDLTPDEQDQLVNELAQEKMGTVPKSGNFLETAIRNAGGYMRGIDKGITLGIPEMAGNYLTDKVMGEGTSKQIEEQTSQYPWNKPAPMAEGLGAGTVGAIGAYNLGKMGIKALFGKQLAKRALPKASGKLSSSIQEVFKRSSSNPNLSVPKEDILKVLDEGLASAKNQKGPQAKLFKDWITNLSKDPNPTVDANTVEEIETAFGHAAKFGKDISANPRLTMAARNVNRVTSDMFDELSKKSGVPEFIKNSAEKSKILKTINSKPSFISKLISKGAEGAALALGGGTGYKIYKALTD